MDNLCDEMGIDVDQRIEMVRIIRGVHGKKKTIYFEGPANCGKTWFAHTILSMVDKEYGVGTVTSQDPRSSFWLSDCPGKPIIYADELLLTIDNVNTAKMLFEANEYLKVDVKNRKRSFLHHKFVLVCSNNNICAAVGGHHAAIEARSLHMRVCVPRKFEMKRDLISRQKYIAAFINRYTE